MKLLALAILITIFIFGIYFCFKVHKLKSEAKYALVKIKQNEIRFNEILNIDNETKRIQEIEKYIIDKLNNYSNLNLLNKHCRNFLLVENLFREVNNGGFQQFYMNSSGNYANITIDALKEIGAIKTANIVQLANNEFPNKTVPTNREVRINLLSQIEKNTEKIWDELNDKFYRPNPLTNELEIDSIIPLQLKYVNENVDEFI